MREFFANLSRGELALLIAAALGLVAWSIVGPSGVLQGVVPALLAGLVCGVVIGLNRRRRGSEPPTR